MATALDSMLEGYRSPRNLIRLPELDGGLV